MTPTWYAGLLTSLLLAVMVQTSLAEPRDRVDPLKVDGKSLFQSLTASHCSVNCVTTRIRPVCGTNDVTYSSRCELKRAKKCDKLRIKVKHKGKCAGDAGPNSQCLAARHEMTESARRHGGQVLIPNCKSDGSYNEIQCHASTGYCWCVTKDGHHIPGTSVKGKRPRCKGKRRRRGKKGGRSKKRRTCSNKDRQTFNTALISVFKEEYLRVHPTPAPQGENDAEVATEKSIVLWKFAELDLNQDGILKFKEIRNFGRMVKKLIQPRSCAKRFVRYCDKKKDRTIEKAEWTLCLGVDIKLSFRMFISRNAAGEERTTASAASGAAGGPSLGALDRITEGLLLREHPIFSGPQNLGGLSSGGSKSHSRQDKSDRKEAAMSCVDEKEAALNYHSQEPKAKPFIPACTPNGLWEKAQCHLARGYCWCVKEANGVPIPGTATYKIKPNCSFENEREMKGCPFVQKRRFLVDLMRDLTEERKVALRSVNKTSDVGPEGNLSLRETVARWKLKSLDANNNGVLERREWRPIRKTTLKNKRYPRKCRRNFVRYCDEDNNKRITHEEWKACLGLNEHNFNSLPINPKRIGRNPFVGQLT